MTKKGRQANSSKIQNRTLLAFRVLSKIFNDIGFTGFCVIVMTILVLFFSSKEQKREIIDTWILFKSENHMAFALIIIFALVVLLIIQQVHYRDQMRLLRERNDYLANEKSNLQSKLIDKGLSSSNTL